MMRQRLLWIAMVGMIAGWAGRPSQAGTVVISAHSTPKVVASSHVGVGVWIGRPTVPVVRRHKPVISVRPRRHRPISVWPRHRRTVVVRHPVIKPVVVAPTPTVVVPAPTAPVVVNTVTIWITNSNGSKTSVRLTREGPWYVGPRGEYYETIPTNEQLRVIYGF